jgi:hypothetical protein
MTGKRPDAQPNGLHGDFASPQKRVVRIIRPSPDPERELRAYTRVAVNVGGEAVVQQPVLGRRYRTIRSTDDLQEALSRHRSTEDVPHFTQQAFDDLHRMLETGGVLRQFELVIPDHLAECKGEQRIVKAMPGMLLLSACSIADLLHIGRRLAEHPLDHGLVDVVKSTWRQGQVRLYAVVNERTGEWARRHERWVPASEIQCPWLFRPEELEASAGMMGKRDTAGHLQVFVGYNLLRWAAGRRDKEQLKRILEAQK